MGELSMVKQLVQSSRKYLSMEKFEEFINIKVTRRMGGNNAILYAISSQSDTKNKLAIAEYLVSIANADPNSMNDYN